MGNEWYTPAKYVDAARKVMDGIDLDVASCDKANEVVKATAYYNEYDNGLLRPWSGRIWLNPPFGKMNGGMGAWVSKLVHEHKRGHVEQAVLLVPVSTEVSWFQLLWEYLICFVYKRLDYLTPDPNNFMHTHQSRFGTCFVYLGPNEQKFIDIFSQFGHVVKTVSKHKAKPATLPPWEESVS